MSTAAVNTYPIENVWEKGHYVARLTGPDPKYVVAREFLRGRPVKTRGIVQYEPADIGELPAWIVRTPETRCGECGRPKTADTELIAALPHGWQVIAQGLHSGELLEILEAGAPGEPGAYTGGRCEDCGHPAIGETCAGCDTTADQVAAAAALGAGKDDPF